MLLIVCQQVMCQIARCQNAFNWKIDTCRLSMGMRTQEKILNKFSVAAGRREVCIANLEKQMNASRPFHRAVKQAK